MLYKKKLTPIVWVFGVLVAAALLPATLAFGEIVNIVNIDFDGFRSGDVMGPTYVGSGAAGGGNVFNGLPADSKTGGDNLTVSAVDLLDSYGTQTTLDFTVSPVGGDVYGAGTPTTDPTSSAALYGDYVFTHSGSPFTISGFDPLVLSADVYFYYVLYGGTVTVDGATPDPFTPHGIFNNSNTMCFLNVPVVGGQIAGQFGPGTTVIKGMTIVSKVPEPGTIVLLMSSLLALGGVTGSRRWRGRRSTSAA